MFAVGDKAKRKVYVIKLRPITRRSKSCLELKSTSDSKDSRMAGVLTINFHYAFINIKLGANKNEICDIAMQCRLRKYENGRIIKPKYLEIGSI